MNRRASHTSARTNRFNRVLAQPRCAHQGADTCRAPTCSRSFVSATVVRRRYSIDFDRNTLRSSPNSQRRSVSLPTKCCCSAITDARCNTPRVRATQGEPSGARDFDSSRYGQKCAKLRSPGMCPLRSTSEYLGPGARTQPGLHRGSQLTSIVTLAVMHTATGFPCTIVGSNRHSRIAERQA